MSVEVSEKLEAHYCVENCDMVNFALYGAFKILKSHA